MSRESQSVGIPDVHVEASRPHSIAVPPRVILTERPANANAWCQHGNRLLELGQVFEAVEAFEQARRLTPEQAPLLNNLGNAFYRLGDFDRALGYYLEATFYQPDSPQIVTHLGCTLAALRHLDAAEQCFSRVLAAAPDQASAHWNRGLLRLLRGDWPRGWDDFEWRWRVPGFAAHLPHYRAPKWRGESLHSLRILLYGEQGYGDTLQFIRYVDLVTAGGAEVTLVVPRPLLRLFRASFPGCRFLTQGDVVPTDIQAQASLMSLPSVFRTTLGSIPNRHPYLQADIAWRPRGWDPDMWGGPRIGVVWAGSPRPQNAAASAVDRRRSVALPTLAPLFAIPGVSFISLQKEQLVAPKGSSTPAPNFYEFGDQLDDFATTAAVIADLDLVISVDTAVAHLASALGKHVWLLSRFDGCWRWLLDRNDSPWYPKLRVFRQNRPGDWGSVIVNVEDELRRWLHERAN